MKKLTLPDILEVISKTGEKLQWSVKFLESAGNLGENISIPELEHYTYHTPEGLFIEWDQLYEMSKKFIYVINGIFIGFKDKEMFVKETKKKDPNLESVADIIIDIDDGDFYKFYSKNEILCRAILNKFGRLPIPIYRTFPK